MGSSSQASSNSASSGNTGKHSSGSSLDPSKSSRSISRSCSSTSDTSFHTTEVCHLITWNLMLSLMTLGANFHMLQTERVLIKTKQQIITDAGLSVHFCVTGELLTHLRCLGECKECILIDLIGKKLILWCGLDIIERVRQILHVMQNPHCC